MDKVKFLMEKNSQILAELENIKKLTKSINEVRSEITQINEGIDDIVGDVNSVNSLLSVLEEDIEDHTASIDNLSQSLSTLSSSVGNITTDVSSVSSSLTELSGDVSECKTDVSTLQTNVTTMSGEIDDLSSDISEINNELESMFSNVKVNENYLINSNFLINQRGASTYSNNNAGINKYTVDRLIHCDNTTYTLTPQERGGVNIFNSSTTDYVKFGQYVEFADRLLANKTVTMSVYVGAEVFSLTSYISLGDSEEAQAKSGYFGIEYLSEGKYMCYFKVPPLVTFSIKWWKLELGDVYTSYSPRSYVEELILCRRYFRRAKFNSVPCVSASNTKVITNIPIEYMRSSISLSNLDVGTWLRGNGAFVNTSSYSASFGSIYAYETGVSMGVEIVFNKSLNITNERVYFLDFVSLDIDAEIY